MSGIRIDRVRLHSSVVLQVVDGHATRVLRRNRGDVYVLAIDAALAVELTGRGAPHCRRRTLLGGLEILGGVDDGLALRIDRAARAQFVLRDVLRQACRNDPAGMNGKGSDAVLRVTPVEFDRE